MSTTIALIHVAKAAISPIEDAFAGHWPEAETINVLDEALMRNLAQAGEMTPALMARIAKLAQFGQEGGAAGILFTCSAFVAAIDAARANMTIPVLKPNEAMLEEAFATGGRIALIATFKPAEKVMMDELNETAAAQGHQIEAQSHYVVGAFDAIDKGDQARHNELIAEAAMEHADCDVMLLAQFSMASALDAVAKQVSCKVLSAPVSAVRKLREQVGQ